jgi:hypothetical protein
MPSSASNSSPGDPTPVFDAVVERATCLCEASSGHLYTYGDQGIALAAVYRDLRLADFLRRHGRYQPPPGISADRIIHGEPVVQIVDVLADDAYLALPNIRDFADVFRTLATVALRKD